MSYDNAAFTPLYSATNGATPGSLVATVPVAASTVATASAQFPGQNPNSYLQFEVANQTTSWAFVNFGVFGAVVPATQATGYPIGPGSNKVFTVHSEVSGASVILAAGTGVVSFTRGYGI